MLEPKRNERSRSPNHSQEIGVEKSKEETKDPVEPEPALADKIVISEKSFTENRASKK